MRRNKKNQAEAKPPIYGNESFGIPSDCTKKQKFNGLKLAFYIVVVASVCGLLYSGFNSATDKFLPEMTFDKSQDALLYIRNHDVTIKDYNDRRGRAVVSSEQLYSSGDGRFVTVTDDEKYVFFAQDNTGTESGFDLCFRRVSAIDGKKEDLPAETKVLDSDVRAYKAHPNGNFVLYLKGNRLYFSNLKETAIVATEVNEFYLSDNSQQMIYYKTDGRVYTRGTTMRSTPVPVDSDITKVLSEKEEYAKIYYLKGNALYVKEHDRERRLIAEGVVDAILLDEFLYFVRKEPNAWRFHEIFVDDKQVYDKELEEPDPKNYYAEDLEGIRYFDEGAYESALVLYEQKVFRDAIREYFDANPITSEQFVLYAVKGNEVRAIDENLAEYTLRYNSSRRTVIYKKNVLQDSKIRLSTVTGIEDALSRGLEFVEKPVSVGMGVLQKNEKPYLGLSVFPKGQIEISLDGKYLYYMEQPSENGPGTLVRYEFGGKELKNRKELCSPITDFALDGADSRVVIAFDGNKMGIVMGDTYTHLSDTSIHDFFYVDGTLYFFDEYNETALSGTLKRFRDGKVKTVDTNVHAFDVRNLKTVAYIKNYNTEFGFGDMYLKTGNKKREKVDICVRSILH